MLLKRHKLSLVKFIQSTKKVLIVSCLIKAFNYFIAQTVNFNININILYCSSYKFVIWAFLFIISIFAISDFCSNKDSKYLEICGNYFQACLYYIVSSDIFFMFIIIFMLQLNQLS